jgi:hypothetical protein
MFVRGCEMRRRFLDTRNNSDNVIILKASLETWLAIASEMPDEQ